MAMDTEYPAKNWAQEWV